MDFTKLFVVVDDFWLAFKPGYQKRLLASSARQRRRDTRLSTSEIMTILIAFQTSGHRTFKHFYLHLLAHHRREFPRLVRYHRFVALIGRATIPLFAYLWRRCRGPVTGIGFVDSTALKVCGNKRIRRHKVFEGLATVGKTTMGWFLGFKLHLVINDRGQILRFALTPGHIDDRKPMDLMCDGLWGKLFGDKGYIGKRLFDRLLTGGLKLVTSIRSSMKNKLMDLTEKLMLRKRSLIETVNDQLKNVCQIEHSRHRSPHNFMAHLLAGLIAYTKKPKRPSLNLNWTAKESNLILA